jgi:hypothetical protein
MAGRGRIGALETSELPLPVQFLAALARDLVGADTEVFPTVSWVATFHDDSHAYLLPEFEMVDDQVAILAEFYDEIFEQELTAWCTDEKTFPAKRTLPMFEEWFDVEFHSTVLDMIDDEGIEHAPY